MRARLNVATNGLNSGYTGRRTEAGEHEGGHDNSARGLCPSRYSRGFAAMPSGRSAGPQDHVL